jgi:two-component system chemotaxis response regulator CheY
MADIKHPTVMVVDDIKIMRTVIKMAVTSLGYRVIAEAEDGNQAVALYKEKKPDLVLLDINMPQKNGDVALKEIMAFDPNAVVMMLTSLSDMKTVEACLDLGAVNYIRKDTKEEGLKATIKETWESLFQDTEE